ncbi:hypothetical protein [Mycolicibacterium sp.]|uniref:hypothetical protein n=1 Tax=Mycolicibacterium sp. TaxID=2320850 RepID=UPI001A319D59|nr:hypothetical protein [Mycolicibacterium sp.]MBJ7340908.1 hypothetical protein [Mycolicibacterium sp.]
MKKFGFAAVVASGFAAGILGMASPILATASAEALPVLELPAYSTGVDHHQWINTIHANVTVPQVDTTVQQSR